MKHEKKAAQLPTAKKIKKYCNASGVGFHKTLKSTYKFLPLFAVPQKCQTMEMPVGVLKMGVAMWWNH